MYRDTARRYEISLLRVNFTSSIYIHNFLLVFLILQLLLSTSPSCDSGGMVGPSHLATVRPLGLLFFHALCTYFHVQSPLLSFAVSFSYYILAVPLRKCLGKH